MAPKSVSRGMVTGSGAVRGQPVGLLENQKNCNLWLSSYRCHRKYPDRLLWVPANLHFHRQ